MLVPCSPEWAPANIGLAQVFMTGSLLQQPMDLLLHIVRFCSYRSCTLHTHSNNSQFFTKLKHNQNH